MSALNMEIMGKISRHVHHEVEASDVWIVKPTTM